MPRFTDGNSSVDESSGAVFYHKSPELLEIIKLRREISNLNTKVDKLLELLEGGKEDGTEVAEPRQCQDNDQ